MNKDPSINGVDSMFPLTLVVLAALCERMRRP